MALPEIKYKLVRDRVNIYRDFTINLIMYIFEYYLDKETLKLDEDIHNHFKFCFNKVCDEYLKEGINFKENSELLDYLYQYFYHQFYKSEQVEKMDYYVKWWDDVYAVDVQRNNNVLRLLVEIYLLFDKSITLEKNILELV